MQIFKQLGQLGSQPRSANELAGSSGADPALLERILRHLAAKGVIDESLGHEISYRATTLSETLATPEGSSGIRQVAKMYTPVFNQVPDFLKSIGYKLPSDNRNGAFQQVFAKPGE